MTDASSGFKPVESRLRLPVIGHAWFLIASVTFVHAKLLRAFMLWFSYMMISWTTRP